LISWIALAIRPTKAALGAGLFDLMDCLRNPPD